MQCGGHGLIPVLGRSPGEGNGYPLQYSSLENSIDRETRWATVHGVTKSWTWLSNFHTKKKEKEIPSRAHPRVLKHHCVEHSIKMPPTFSLNINLHLWEVRFILEGRKMRSVDFKFSWNLAGCPQPISCADREQPLNLPLGSNPAITTPPVNVHFGA